MGLLRADADRLLLNIIVDSQRYTNDPLAPLPANWEQMLAEIGYDEQEAPVRKSVTLRVFPAALSPQALCVEATIGAMEG